MRFLRAGVAGVPFFGDNEGSVHSKGSTVYEGTAACSQKLVSRERAGSFPEIKADEGMCLCNLCDYCTPAICMS